ncbi:MAG: hypothetical protein H0T66_16005 [Geodermatophilaceae bacterium]|nr:hypothetical protein [Geodermatophilaceae bacterium]
MSGAGRRAAAVPMHCTGIRRRGFFARWEFDDDVDAHTRDYPCGELPHRQLTEATTWSGRLLRGHVAEVHIEQRVGTDHLDELERERGAAGLGVTETVEEVLEREFAGRQVQNVSVGVPDDVGSGLGLGERKYRPDQAFVGDQPGRYFGLPHPLHSNLLEDVRIPDPEEHVAGGVLPPHFVEVERVLEEEGLPPDPRTFRSEYTPLTSYSTVRSRSTHSGSNSPESE